MTFPVEIAYMSFFSSKESMAENSEWFLSFSDNGNKFLIQDVYAETIEFWL